MNANEYLEITRRAVSEIAAVLETPRPMTERALIAQGVYGLWCRCTSDSPHRTFEDSADIRDAVGKMFTMAVESQR